MISSAKPRGGLGTILSADSGVSGSSRGCGGNHLPEGKRRESCGVFPRRFYHTGTLMAATLVNAGTPEPPVLPQAHLIGYNSGNPPSPAYHFPQTPSLPRT